MKKTLLFFLATSVSFSVFSQSGTVSTMEAPLNTSFKMRTDWTQVDSEENFGLVAEPVTVDYTNYVPNTRRTMALPAVFDMRTTGGITSVKNQGSCGSCWLFPSMGSVESRWKRLGLGDYDLAEDNLKHCNLYSYAPCAGGNRLMATAYFSRGKGPVLETADPYSASSAPVCPTGLTPVANITEAWFLPNKSISDIKQVVYDQGAVYNTFYWNNKWYNSSTRVYCQTRDSAVTNNHAVLIVGWNDNIVTPLGTGAWIIKNSWGPSWGDAGFFYISYQDKRAAQDPTIWVGRGTYNNRQVFYGYDDLGWTNSMGGAKTCYGAVKFTATANQKIKQIATYAVAPNTTISAEIYSNFNGSIFSGLLGSVPAKTFQYAGYYTMDLSVPFNINANTTFYVKYKVVNTTTNFPLASESVIAGYTNAVVVETGKCWMSTNGSSWTALGATMSLKHDLCMKVIAEDICPPTTATIITNTLVNLCSANTTTITVSTNNASASFQWQISPDNGATWANVVNGTKYVGAQTSALVVKNVTLGFDNYMYKCSVVGSCNSASSNAVRIRVTSTPVIITNPLNVSVAANAMARFDVSVSNPTNCTYQWQINTSGTTWTDLINNTNVSGATTSALSVKGIATYSAKNFRCKLKSSCTATYKYSSSAKLTIQGGSSPLKTTAEDAEESNTESMQESSLSQDVVMYPNPAIDNISIDYETQGLTFVEISIYDILGQKVDTISSEKLESGNHTTEYNLSNLKNGTYLVIMSSKNDQGKSVNLHKRLIVAHQ